MNKKYNIYHLKKIKKIFFHTCGKKNPYFSGKKIFFEGISASIFINNKIDNV